jgi:hypothetical protein
MKNRNETLPFIESQGPSGLDPSHFSKFGAIDRSKPENSI